MDNDRDEQQPTTHRWGEKKLFKVNSVSEIITRVCVPDILWLLAVVSLRCLAAVFPPSDQLAAPLIPSSRISKQYWNQLVSLFDTIFGCTLIFSPTRLYAGLTTWVLYWGDSGDRPGGGALWLQSVHVEDRTRSPSVSL